MMSWRRTRWTLLELVLALSLLTGVSYAQVPTTQVTETVYRADGSAASGTLLVSWPSFTAASGAAVPAGSTSVTIGAGGAMTVPLVPNAGATPMGSYYTVVYHLDDGSVTREYWVVPVSAYPVQVSAIKSTVLPLSVAMQTVSKAYVDTAVAAAVAGHPLDTSNPYVLKAGDTMTGALELPGDPTSALQAADKQYVDEQSAALTAGLAQKVSTLPFAAQAVAQPEGTTLAVNNLNGVAYASRYATSTGTDGIAQAVASTDCASGCTVVAEPTYNPSEAVAATSLNGKTHVSDTRGGAVVDTYLNPENPHANGLNAAETLNVVSTRSSADLKAAEGVVQPYSVGLSVAQQSLAGGSNLFPQLVQGSVPYFKTTYTAVDTRGVHNTLGQHVLTSLNQTCYAVGDCLLGGYYLTSSGGFRDDADEGTHPYDLVMSEDAKVFEGTCAGGCTTGSTTVQIAPTANAGTQGEGRFLIDTNPAKVLTGGVLTGGSTDDPLTGTLARLPIANFSGTSFPVSTLLETAQVIPTQANDVRPGTVTVTIATSGVPAGFQTNTAALPTASGVACVTDASEPDTRPLNYEMAAYTTVDGSHLRLTLNKAHATGATIAVGGLCGYGLEQTVDTASGIRQVFPVAASTSATTLLYAGGLSSIVGLQGNTSAYLNVNATIASVSRSANVVTVTTAGNLPVDVNGLTMTVAGVADSSFNGSFSVTSTGPNTLTYAQGGANSSSTGGTASVVTGGYALYPMAEVLGVYNASTKAIDGQMTLAANNVAWAAGDTVEQPHYFQEDVSTDTTFVTQTTPRPRRTTGAGVSFGGNSGPGLHGWQVTNLVDPTQYLGNGGTHSAPDVALEVLGPWKRAMSLEAGEQAAFAVHCNSHGCGKWNSAYNLFELDSSVGTDTVQYTPTTSTLGINVRGTGYSFSPTSFTAGTINATTIHAGTVTGAISAGSLPVFVASGGSHSVGAVPDPGATAGTTRYLREDGTWNAPPGSGVSSAPTVATEQISSAGVYTKYHAYGDSYTYGLGASVPANNYVSLLARYAGLDPTTSAVVNHGVTGWYACDVNSYEVFSTAGAVATDNTMLQTLFEGINDGNNLPPIRLASEEDYLGCHAANIAWLGTGSTPRYTGASFGSVPSGWSLDTRYAAVSGLSTTTNGASASWPVTVTVQGQTIFLFYRVMNGNGGQFSYSGCGFSGTVANYPAKPIDTNFGTTDAVYVLPLSNGNTMPGACSIATTAVSPTGSGNIVSVLAVGLAPPSLGASTPKLWVAGVPEMQPKTLGIAPGGVALINHDSAQTVRTMRTYGLDVNFVDIRAWFDNSPAQNSGDTIHPGDVGYAAIAQAWEAPTSLVAYDPKWSTPSNSGPAAAVNVNTATYAASCGQRLLSTSATTTLELPGNCANGEELTIVNATPGTTVTLAGPGTAGVAGYAGSFAIPGLTYVQLKFQSPYWVVIAENARRRNPSAVTLYNGGAGGTGQTTATCLTTCSAEGGRVALTTGTSPTNGWLFSIGPAMSWPSGSTLNCTATQVGGAAWYGVGTSNVNATYMQVDVANAPPAGTTVTVDWSCAIP